MKLIVTVDNTDFVITMLLDDPQFTNEETEAERS